LRHPAIVRLSVDAVSRDPSGERCTTPNASIGTDQLDETVRSILALAASYRPGTIIKAERVVDAYLDDYEGYRARRAAMDALLRELALPEHRARNRGGLFELIELHLRRRHGEIARLFQ
jgi:hypothetical protein